MKVTSIVKTNESRYHEEWYGNVDDGRMFRATAVHGFFNIDLSTKPIQNIEDFEGEEYAERYCGSLGRWQFFWYMEASGFKFDDFSYKKQIKANE